MAFRFNSWLYTMKIFHLNTWLSNCCILLINISLSLPNAAFWTKEFSVTMFGLYRLVLLPREALKKGNSIVGITYPMKVLRIQPASHTKVYASSRSVAFKGFAQTHNKYKILRSGTEMHTCNRHNVMSKRNLMHTTCKFFLVLPISLY